MPREIESQDSQASNNRSEIVNPADTLAAIQREMEASGVPSRLSQHIAPINPADVRHIYTGRGEQTLPNGSGGQAQDGSEGIVTVDLMVGTTRPIGEIAAQRYTDQEPSVNVQWRSRQYPRKLDSSKEIEREEVEQIDEYTFVRRHYDGVSALGARDGDLTVIELLEETAGFHPQSPYSGRKMWKITQYHRTKEGKWKTWPGNVSGATLLNGIQELIALDLPHVRRVGGSARYLLESPSIEAEVAHQLLSLPAPAEDEFKRADAIGREHPQVIEEMRAQMESILDVSIEQLQSNRIAYDTIEGFIDVVLRYPDRVRVLGRSLSSLDANQRFQLAQALSKEGLTHFKEWYQRSFGEGINYRSIVAQRVIAASLLHFTQFWNSQTNGRFEAPDYKALASGFEQLRAGDRHVAYSLSQRIFQGLQSSAIEIFVEDYILGQKDKKLPGGK